MNLRKHQVFVSYRRHGGAELARNVYDALRRRGYRVFMDVEGLKQGHFNRQLFAKIERANDFVVILTPGSMARCSAADDWLRTEISHAIKTRRNVVPVLADGFEWAGVVLPPEMKSLKDYQAVSGSHELFEGSMDRLSGFLVSTRHLALKRLLLVILLAAAYFTAGHWYGFARLPAGWPGGTAQETLASRELRTAALQEREGARLLIEKAHSGPLGDATGRDAAEADQLFAWGATAFTNGDFATAQADWTAAQVKARHTIETRERDQNPLTITMAGIIMPECNFRNAGLTDILEWLKDACNDTAPSAPTNAVVVNIQLLHGDGSRTPQAMSNSSDPFGAGNPLGEHEGMTFQVRNMSAVQILNRTCAWFDCRWYIQDDCVIVEPETQSGAPATTSFVPSSTETPTDGEGDTTAGSPVTDNAGSAPLPSDFEGSIALFKIFVDTRQNNTRVLVALPNVVIGLVVLAFVAGAATLFTRRYRHLNAAATILLAGLALALHQWPRGIANRVADTNRAWERLYAHDREEIRKCIDEATNGKVTTPWLSDYYASELAADPSNRHSEEAVALLREAVFARLGSDDTDTPGELADSVARLVSLLQETGKTNELNIWTTLETTLRASATNGTHGVTEANGSGVN